MPGETTDALITSFTSEASARFGVGGYFAAVIGFDPSFAFSPTDVDVIVEVSKTCQLGVD